MSSELVWIHHFNANELGLSEDGTGTGRGAFCLVPVEARQIFLSPLQEQEIENGAKLTIDIYLSDIDTRLSVNYSKPPSKSEHRLSFAGLSQHIGLDDSYPINPHKIACFYRKGNEICMTLASVDSAYGRLLNDFPSRGRNNNLVTKVVFVSENQANYSVQSLQKGANILLYGVAGVGKSYNINKITGGSENNIERIVFHPDYLNTDFVGQILPTVKDNGNIDYQFKAGSFTKILKKAILDPSNHYYLAIEEINRGNAPAIFGEVFQLLDRKDDGSSTYRISHDLMAKEIFDDPNRTIYIPNNLTILATMNTADQNVFTLDTAFQRRWTMRMIENNIENCDYKNVPVLDTGVSWQQFNTVINEHILEVNKDTLSSEDKRLGAFFIRADELKLPTDLANGIPFAEKVIKYLWDDVFKFNKFALFKSDLNSLDKVLREFKNKQGFSRFDIFNDDIQSKLKQGQQSPSPQASNNSNEI